MSEDPEQSHLLIRYNENIANTRHGWRDRMEYISRIFGEMGFECETRGGYLHMSHPNPGDSEAMKPLLGEAFRGLASTTHLNLTFEDFPKTLDMAVEAFNSGVTNVYGYIEDQPEIKRQKRLWALQEQNALLRIPTTSTRVSSYGAGRGVPNIGTQKYSPTPKK